MRRYVIFVWVFMFLFFAIAKNVTATQADPLKTGDMLYYLMNNKIYKISVPYNGKSDLVYAVSQDQNGQAFQINALSCGPNNTLLFHAVSSAPPPSTDKLRTMIVAYNVKNKVSTRLVDLVNESLLFPVLSPDESKLAMTGRDSFFVKDLKSDTMVYYAQFAKPNQRIFPWSWSPDGKVLVLSAQIIGMPPIINFFDTERKALAPGVTGMQPHFSPNGRLIAYLSPGYGELVISDRAGNVIQSFKGYLFKAVNGWIEEDKVLFTIGVHGYVDHIGVADLKSNKVFDMKVPTAGEINGICFKRQR
jgi:hypothetical protein